MKTLKEMIEKIPLKNTRKLALCSAQDFDVVYHMNKCAHEIFTNQQDWKFIARSANEQETEIKMMREMMLSLKKICSFTRSGFSTSEARVAIVCLDQLNQWAEERLK